jgi:hypothetical protein
MIIPYQLLRETKKRDLSHKDILQISVWCYGKERGREEKWVRTLKRNIP